MSKPDIALIDFDPTWMLPDDSVVILPGGEAALLQTRTGMNEARGERYWRTTGGTWLSDLSGVLPVRVVYNPLKVAAEGDGYEIGILATVEDAIKAYKENKK